MKKKQQRPTGILGGLGQETTAEFQTELIRLATDAKRPELYIWSIPLNPKKEVEYIREGKHLAYYFRLLLKGARGLARAGCGRIVIPCNTVHEFLPWLTAAVEIPVTNLIEVVAEEVRRREWTEVLLLATSRTIETRLYQDALEPLGIRVMMPNPVEQGKLDSLEESLLGEKAEHNHRTFLEGLVAGKKVVLGCTDLQLLLPPSETVVDSMHELAIHTAKLIRES